MSLPESRGQGSRRGSTLWLMLVAILLVACGGHESRVRDALDALDRGAPEEAIAHLNEEMEVATKDDLPANVVGDDALLLLDRASIQMSTRDFGRSSRDFGAADKAIELLDMRASAADDLGKYLFSDDVGRYRAPPYEKVMINTMNLLSYLAVGKLADAKVEARRLAVLERYLKDQGDDAYDIALGNYLAAFTLEKSRETSEALLFYDEALSKRSFSSLAVPLASLTKKQTDKKRIQDLIEKTDALPPLGETGECDLLVVVGVGRVPEKEPRRIPIGLALTLVAGHLSPHDRARANELAAKGLVTWINFPTLGASRGRFSNPVARLDGRPMPLELAADLEAEARAAFKEAETALILSAITRMLARAAIGELTQLGASGGKREGGAGVFGVIAGLAATATLAVLDTPDTRSWVTLPSHLVVGRTRISAGKHTLRVSARGVTQDITVEGKKGGYVVVPVNILR